MRDIRTVMMVFAVMFSGCTLTDIPFVEEPPPGMKERVVSGQTIWNIQKAIKNRIMTGPHGTLAVDSLEYMLLRVEGVVINASNHPVRIRRLYLKGVDGSQYNEHPRAVLGSTHPRLSKGMVLQSGDRVMFSTVFLIPDIAEVVYFPAYDLADLVAEPVDITMTPERVY